MAVISVWDRILNRFFPLTDEERRMCDEHAALLKAERLLVEARAIELTAANEAAAREAKRDEEREDDFRQVACYELDGYCTQNGNKFDVINIIRLKQNTSSTKKLRRLEVDTYRKDGRQHVMHFIPSATWWGYSKDVMNQVIIPWWNWQIATDDLRGKEGFTVTGKPPKPKKKEPAE